MHFEETVSATCVPPGNEDAGAADTAPIAGHGFTTNEVKAELDRIVGSPDFRASPRNRRFLEFVVLRTLTQPDSRISAYDVATQVFGRPDTFNPVKDPIVRIEAGKLRRDLETFYLKAGSRGRLRIEMPKGGYRAGFLPATPEPAASDCPPTASLSDDPMEELQRVLSSSDFPATARNRKFLDFVVRETLAGRADGITARTIGLRVLGRPASFNPNQDPIVRIEAGRLRRDLETYYLKSGHRNPLRISIPRGGYLPVFAKP
ncbi:MAG: hypothetical protein FGM15_02645 [Chthoniobacterales bacterium]|nr:hypothetical protein [Chthoniobacterales bacterium]